MKRSDETPTRTRVRRKPSKTVSMRKGGTEDQLIPGYTDTIDVNSHIGEFMRAFPD